jgi:hypothetical protein
MKKINNIKSCETCIHNEARKENGLMHKPCKACIMYSQSTGKKYSEYKSK